MPINAQTYLRTRHIVVAVHVDSRQLRVYFQQQTLVVHAVSFNTRSMESTKTTVFVKQDILLDNALAIQ